MTALLLIPAVAIGVTALFVLLHDLRQLALDGYLALYTTGAAAVALGIAVCLLTIAT